MISKLELNTITYIKCRTHSFLGDVHCNLQLITLNDHILKYFLHLPVSPDGLLLQSSTVADSVPFEFSDGTTEYVPCSYIEFAERLVLPQYRNLPETEVRSNLSFEYQVLVFVDNLINLGVDGYIWTTFSLILRPSS